MAYSIYRYIKIYRGYNMNFITPEQVAELLKVDLDTVLLWLKQKKLPGVKIGNIWRIEESRLLEFLSSAMDEQSDRATRYEAYNHPCAIPVKGKRGSKPTGKYD